METNASSQLLLFARELVYGATLLVAMVTATGILLCRSIVQGLLLVLPVDSLDFMTKDLSAMR
jgi:hypothetical protein